MLWRQVRVLAVTRKVPGLHWAGTVWPRGADSRVSAAAGPGNEGGSRTWAQPPLGGPRPGNRLEQGYAPPPVPGAHSSPERVDLSIPEHTGDPAFCGSFSVFRPEWFSRARAWPEKVGRDTCCVLPRLLCFCRGSGWGLRPRGHLASQIPHSLTPPGSRESCPCPGGPGT